MKTKGRPRNPECPECGAPTNKEYEYIAEDDHHWTNLDNAIEAATEALRPTRGGIVSDERYLARIAVEAAAPHLCVWESFKIEEQRAERAEAAVDRMSELCGVMREVHGELERRAEKAEAEAKRLRAADPDAERKDMQFERALSDRLAEAIRPYVENTVPSIRAAYAAYEEARRNG